MDPPRGSRLEAAALNHSHGWETGDLSSHRNWKFLLKLTLQRWQACKSPTLQEFNNVPSPLQTKAFEVQWCVYIL